ncbi:DUF1189 domain-containing protein [Bacillus kwashiorkori]|uniref:DUF1189 domain-containing protein n=1 Tax=Bacillus kwashiorkori TaxID=1522318 RepID=UPI000784474E|nr:DUF1189 domain-containing protein [Bacillus kwashiorkori]
MNIFKQFFKSLYSPKDIASFHSQKMGKTILYIFLISILTTVPIVLNIHSIVNNFIGDTKDIIIDEVPNFHITDYELQMDESEPVTINADGVTLLFDNSKLMTEVDIEKNTIKFVKDGVIADIDGTTDSFTYASLELNDINKNTMVEILNLVDSSLPIITMIVFFIAYLIFTAGNFIKVSVLGLLSLILVSSFRLDLKYGNVWKISAYSITLPITFFAIMNSFGATVPFGGAINWGVSLLMIFLALKELTKNTTDIA